MRLTLCLIASLLAGCVASGVPATAPPGAQPSCVAPEGELLAAIRKCPGRTAEGLSCHVCRDYAGCVVGEGEAADYCVDAALGCDDPACQ